MNLLYVALFIYLIPTFVLYVLLCFTIPLIKIGKKQNKKGVQIHVVKDTIHSDYLFSTKDIGIFPAKNKYIKIGWGDRKIFFETPRWKDLKMKDFIWAFFGLNDTVLKVEYLNHIPENSKLIEIDQEQLQIIQTHIKRSFYGDQIEKKPNYIQKGEFYRSKLKYNPITNCNNWVNRGLYLSCSSNRLWCPISFWL